MRVRLVRALVIGRPRRCAAQNTSAASYLAATWPEGPWGPGGHPWGHGFKNYKEVLKAGAGWNWWSQHVSAWTVRSTHTLFISSPGNYLGKRPQTVLQRT